MCSRSFWHQSLCESSERGLKTNSFLTTAPLLATQQIPSPSSTKALILIFGPSAANPRTSFSTIKLRWPLSDHRRTPSANRVTGVTVPFMRTRSESMGWADSGRSMLDCVSSLQRVVEALLWSLKSDVEIYALVGADAGSLWLRLNEANRMWTMPTEIGFIYLKTLKNRN